MHVLGFTHNTGDLGNTSYGTNRYGNVMGPSEDEKLMAKQVYGVTERTLTRMKSFNGGSSEWFEQSTNLNAYGVNPYRRFNAVQDTSRSLFCYSRLPNRDPAYLWGTNTLNSFSTSIFFGGLQTAGGVDCAGRDSEYMMTYIDGRDDMHHVQVLFSTGQNWWYRNPPQDFSALGDPAIVKLKHLGLGLSERRARRFVRYIRAGRAQNH